MIRSDKFTYCRTEFSKQNLKLLTTRYLHYMANKKHEALKYKIFNNFVAFINRTDHLI
jgi:hypothetical protein